MQTVDLAGERLNPKLFIRIFRDVLKLSPARFLTLHLHQDRYKELYALADIPESIQIGPVLGPMGRQQMRVNCIKPPLGVSDGILVIVDSKTDPDKLEFSIHGIPEYRVVHLATS
jgi:hypothetical protein